MSNSEDPEVQTPSETVESFDELLSQYEREHAALAQEGPRQLEGTIVAITADAVLVDIGYKTEGTLPLTAFPESGAPPKPGDKLVVSVVGRDADGYYQLSRKRLSQPKDWSALEQAFASKATIVGTVTEVVKGGLSVDIGVRAFMPSSRSGVRDAADLDKLVGQEIQCRITKLDVSDEDVVVDRRVVIEEEASSAKEQRYAELHEDDVVRGTVRSLTEYGAFIDLGGVDGLLHVSDISWSRIAKPEDALSVGQEIDAKVLKIDSEKQRISLGMKQLLAHPWDAVPEKYKVGDRVRGTISRVADFGAFLELEPGIEGLIHISEMSWTKKRKSASDLVKPGEVVEAVILGISTPERRISLGLKQALGDPWADAISKFPAGSTVAGKVTNLAKFGAFVELEEGVEGLVHISEISADKRLNHPQEVLKVGQSVKALVLAIDRDKRLIRLSLKQLVPSDLDEYLAEHKVGDLVSGRVVSVSIENGAAQVEFGDGVYGACLPAEQQKVKADYREGAGAAGNVTDLGAMLLARWKGGGAASTTAESEPLRTGQTRQFRITLLDAHAKRLEVEAV